MTGWKRNAFVYSLAACICMFGLSAHAQNPFGDSAKESLPAPNRVAPPIASRQSKLPADFPALPDSASASQRLIVETIASGNPQTPSQLAQAIDATLDIERFEVAKYYLNRLISLEMEDAATFEMYESVGAAFFLRVHSVDNLAPEGREWVAKVMNVVERQAKSSERLESLIARLGNEKIEIRSAAFRELKATGDAAAAAMLNVFADANRREEFLAVRSGLRLLGDNALSPLLAATRSPVAQVQYEAYTALARFKNPIAYQVAYCGMLSPRVNEVIQKAIAVGFNEKYGGIEPAEAILEQVRENARRFLLGQNQPIGDVRLNAVQPYATNWKWNSDTNKLVSNRVPPATAQRLFALELGRDLYDIDSTHVRDRELFLLAQLDANKRLVGPDGLLTATSLRSDFQNISASEIDQTIAAALNYDLIAAAAGGCDLLGQVSDSEQVLKNLSVDSGIIRALKAGDHHLEFCALRAVAAVDPQSSFFGSSYVMATALHLASFGERPVGLIGHNHIQTAQDIAVGLNASGLLGKATANSRDFYRNAIEDANIQYLLISDSLYAPDYLELAQQLRNDWRTSRLPIAILTTGNNSSRAQRIADRDPRMIVLPMTDHANSIVLQVEQLKQLVEPWPITLERSQMYSAFAVEWLQNIVADREVYGFYEPHQYETELVGLLFNPLHTESALSILGDLGTAQAQIRLLDFASQSTAPIEWRQIAAQSFGQAIQTHGLLVTGDDIKRQYARYNASETDTVDVQQLLGSILDAIEYRAAQGRQK
ncbi:MAG: hypothetical protein R3C03_20445 [Pirellulaceae bacterium]